MRYSRIETQPLLHLCITEPLRLGSARIIEENPRGILAYDAMARLHLLSAEDAAAANALLEHVENPYFILCCQGEFAPLLDRFGFAHSMHCSQWAYLKTEIPEADPGLIISPPDDAAFARILTSYRMSTPEELALQRSRGQILFARTPNGQDAGFVGLHPEGCFGLLEVFPEQRRKGYGAALEKHIIRFCMERGNVPYCQVNVENLPSLNLQRKLGMEMTEEIMYMAWKNE